MKTRENDLLRAELRVINLGLPLFAASLSSQSVQVAQVAWKPPLELEPELRSILDELL